MSWGLGASSRSRGSVALTVTPAPIVKWSAAVAASLGSRSWTEPVAGSGTVGSPALGNSGLQLEPSSELV